MIKILKGQFIDEHGIDCLKNYKYKSGSYTFMDNAMQPWWEFFVSCVPLWVAPNLMTLAALFFPMSAVCAFAYYDTSASVQMSPLLLCYSAFCLFMYQTLDACDGKQARRTKTSSPLGQLFDHGCDALNTIFGFIMFMETVCYGNDWTFHAIFALTLSSFYLSQWEEQHTHILRTHAFGFGCTELQDTVIASSLLAAATDYRTTTLTPGDVDFLAGIIGETKLFGSELVKVPFVKLFFFVFCTFAIVNGLLSTYQSLCKTQMRPRAAALLGLLPLFLTYGCYLLTLYQTEWAGQHLLYLSVLMVPAYSLVVSRQIVCNFTEMDIDPFPKTLLWFVLFYLNRHAYELIPDLEVYANYTDSQGIKLLLPENIVALFVFCVTLVWYLIFAFGTVKQICYHLEINCLTIKQEAASSRVSAKKQN